MESDQRAAAPTDRWCPCSGNLSSDGDTSDVALIQGPPGTGKTRVICEIVRQAVQQGQRVLLAAPTHVAVDNVLERIGATDEVCPIRCASEIKIPDLPNHIQQFTYKMRAEPLMDESLSASAADESRTVEKIDQLDGALDAAQTCLRLGEDSEENERSRQALLERLKAEPRRVEQEHSTNTKQADEQLHAAKKSATKAELDLSTLPINIT